MQDGAHIYVEENHSRHRTGPPMARCAPSAWAPVYGMSRGHTQRLRGPYRQKMTKFWKKKNLMNYQHVADVVVEFYSCATCIKGGLGGVEQHYNASIFKKCLLKSRCQEKFKFSFSKEPTYHSFWATGLILVSKEAVFSYL